MKRKEKKKKNTDTIGFENEIARRGIIMGEENGVRSRVRRNGRTAGRGRETERERETEKEDAACKCAWCYFVVRVRAAACSVIRCYYYYCCCVAKNSEQLRRRRRQTNRGRGLKMIKWIFWESAKFETGKKIKLYRPRPSVLKSRRFSRPRAHTTVATRPRRARTPVRSARKPRARQRV